MTYEVPLSQIFKEHRNAWNAIVGNCKDEMTWKEIDDRYEKRCNATLIRNDPTRGYTSIIFNSEADYVLFLLEWS